MRSVGHCVTIEGRCRAAFARSDLVTLMACLGVGLLLLWSLLLAGRSWRRSSTAGTCLANLAAIGKAVQMYATDNRDKLPYAGIRTPEGKQWSWDDLLSRHLGETRSASQLESATPDAPMKVLRCPADKDDLINPHHARGGAHRRTYAMPRHDMTSANWPPGPGNSTGVGLFWDVTRDSTFPLSARRWRHVKAGGLLDVRDAQASFIAPMISQPARTMAMTEHVHTNNIIGNALEASILNATEHIHIRTPMTEARFHGGRFNYLFLDGHAETLTPLSTLGANPSPAYQSGMWTVNPND